MEYAEGGAHGNAEHGAAKHEGEPRITERSETGGKSSEFRGSLHARARVKRFRLQIGEDLFAWNPSQDCSHPRRSLPGWVILVACEIKFEDEMRVRTGVF